jgi:hypothetical protein
LNDSFAGKSTLVLKLFLLSARNISPQALLRAWEICCDFDEFTFVCCFFSLTAFNILSLFSMLVLMTICHGVVLFWSSLFGVWRLPVPEWP